MKENKIKKLKKINKDPENKNRMKNKLMIKKINKRNKIKMRKKMYIEKELLITTINILRVWSSMANLQS